MCVQTVIEELIQSGADVNAKIEDMTPLQYAAAEGNYDAMEILKKYKDCLPGGKPKPSTLEEWIEYYMQDGTVSREEAEDLAEMEMM